MSSDDRLIAARYVQALFDLGEENNQHDKIKADMLMLKSILSGSDEFKKLLASPVISRDASEQAITKVLAALNACELTQKFFVLLARKRRLSLTALAIDTYLERLAVARNELTVDVTSAHSLNQDEMKIISQSIAKSTGKKVEIRARENPELLGGLQVRVGSRLFDNSITGKLARLKQSLIKAA